MSRKLKYSKKDLIDMCEKMYGDEYTVMSEYKGYNKHVTMKHNTCGHVWNIAFGNFFKKKQQCPHCSRMNRRKSNDEFIKEVETLVGDTYTMLEKYKTKKDKLKMRHNYFIKDGYKIECGYEFNMTPDDFVNCGNRCPKCGGKRQLDSDSVSKLIKEKHNLTLISSFNGVKSDITVRNNTCGHEYSTSSYKAIYNNSHNCKICGKHKKNINIEDVKKEFMVEDKDYTILSEKYSDTHDKLIVRHDSCGHEYEVSRTNFIGSPERDGRRCPECSASNPISQQELELVKYIKKIYNGVIKTSDREILNGKELDIYLPELNVAIEYNGLYWHSSKFLDRKYHYNKTKLCDEKGIRLIHVFEDEWIYKTDIVKSKLEHILGLNTNPRVYARKCYIEEIDNNYKREFLDSNHIQGSDRSNIKLGMWYPESDNEHILVAVMTFSKLRLSLGRTHIEGQYELSRFAGESEYLVVGGFGKLLKHFTRNYEFTKLITYADKRYSIDKENVYTKCGFTHTHDSKPSYYYISSSTNKRENRFKYRKQELKKLFPKSYSSDKTEKEIMKENGYYRVYNVGNMVFELLNEDE